MLKKLFKSQEVRVTFLVTVPEGTPEDDNIYIVGNHEKLGHWKAGDVGIKLNKVSPLKYQGSFLCEKGASLNFKFTRGSWETVEKDSKFHERANRTLVVKRGQAVHYKVDNWSDMGVPKHPTKRTWTGIIKEHRNFHATKLKNDRTIWVYLPPNYFESKRKRYPVLYAHDGNNVFDARTAFLGVEWELDETAEMLIKQKKIREIIIVAIENTIHREDEYTPIPMPGMGGGKADLYADFIINDIKPFIDETYRTLKDRQYTAIMGSSLGGLVSMYISWKYSHIFSMAAVVSPSVWWANRYILDVIKKTEQPPSLRIWLDIGTEEGKVVDENGKEIYSAVKDTRKLRDVLIKAGYQLNKNLQYMEDEGALHNEAAWAKRVDKILLYLFGKRSKLGLIKKVLKL